MFMVSTKVSSRSPDSYFTHEGLMGPQLPSKFFLAKSNLDALIPQEPAQCLLV